MPVPFGCIPQALSLVVCVYTLIVKVCSMERTAAATSSSGEPASICLEKLAHGSRSNRSGPHSASCFQSWRKGRERKWPGGNGAGWRSVSALLSSAGKKTPNGHNGNEVDLVITLTEKKKRHFLLVVVVPFRNFWFVLLNYGALEFPNYQSTHKALLHSLSVHASAVSYSPKRETFLTNW